MEFGGKKGKAEIRPVFVAFGDEPFLRRQAVLKIRDAVVGPEPDDFTLAEHVGGSVSLAAVLDDLHTPPFIGDRRLVVVEDADPFVSAHREALLRYVEAPTECGVLLLEVQSWSATTKLYKAVEQVGLAVDCKAPKAWHVGSWCVKWAAVRYHKKIAKETADWLVELVGTELGLLDQELDKLAGAVGPRDDIDLQTVNRLVAGSRTETAFKLLDLVFEGQAGKALELLDRQLLAGESPVGVLAMMTSQLRKLTRAARGVVAGQAMDAALSEAGIAPYFVDKAKNQLRHLGRPRMAAMYRRLLQTDLHLKGGSILSPRTIIERFLLDLGRKDQPRRDAP